MQRVTCAVLAMAMVLAIPGCRGPVSIVVQAEGEILGNPVKGSLSIKVGAPSSSLPSDCQQSIGSTVWRGRIVELYECDDEESYWICIEDSSKPYRPVVGGLPPKLQSIIDAARANATTQSGHGSKPDPTPALLPTSHPVPLGNHVFDFDVDARTAGGTITLPGWAVWKQVPAELGLDVVAVVEQIAGGNRVTLEGSINGVAGALAYNGIRDLEIQHPDHGLIQGHFDEDWGAWLIDQNGKPYDEFFVIQEIF